MLDRYRKPYGKLLRMLHDGAKTMPDPAPVVELLQDVLRARFPPSRQAIGADSYFVAFIGAFVPDCVIDLIFG